MGKANSTEDFKRDAVVQITERGYPVAEVAARLGISKYSLYEWKKRYGSRAPSSTIASCIGIKRLRLPAMIPCSLNFS